MHVHKQSVYGMYFNNHALSSMFTHTCNSILHTHKYYEILKITNKKYKTYLYIVYVHVYILTYSMYLQCILVFRITWLMYRFRFLAFSKSPLLIPFDAPFSPNLSEKSIENSKINFQLQENNSHVQTEKNYFKKLSWNQIFTIKCSVPGVFCSSLRFWIVVACMISVMILYLKIKTQKHLDFSLQDL